MTWHCLIQRQHLDIPPSHRNDTQQQRQQTTGQVFSGTPSAGSSPRKPPRTCLFWPPQQWVHASSVPIKGPRPLLLSFTPSSQQENNILQEKYAHTFMKRQNCGSLVLL
uniref:Uncharacterized protein n=1 Tax=Sphaerodactylus townsendi TaxID=933632 RepID=A0ACB8EAN8_9SAUR